MSSFQRLFLKSTCPFIDENCHHECFHYLLAKTFFLAGSWKKHFFFLTAYVTCVTLITRVTIIYQEDKSHEDHFKNHTVSIRKSGR